MASSSLTCDENGYVKGFAYHDGFLEGVLAAGPDVHLALRSTGHEYRVVTLRQVVAFQVEGFREGNIVLNLRLLPASRAVADAEVRSLLADRLFLEPAKLSGDAHVFQLEASFGADIIAVCGGAEVSEAGVRLALSR